MRLVQRTQLRLLLSTAIVGVCVCGAISLSARGASAHADATPAAGITVARFFGGVSGSGAGLANGTTVTASVEGVACGVGTVSGGQYTVDVQELPGCINPGKKVDFIINGRPASPQGLIPSLQGAAVQVNLTVAQATPSPSPSPSPTAAPTSAPTSAVTAAPAASVATAAPTRSSGPPPPPTLPPSAGATRTATPAASPARTATKAAATASPKAAAAPAKAQLPTSKPAPALPKTGTGGAERDGRTATLLGLVLAAAAVLGGAGALALRREP